MIIDDNPGEDVYEHLLGAIISVRPPDHPNIERRAKRFAVLERDAKGNILGGAYAYVHPGWVYIDLLWTAEKVRGKGLGKRIMAQVEAEALRRGCHSAYLWTQDFEAPGLYKKLGYKEFVMLDDFIPGHQRFGFMKKLGK